jgi:hypothetical protein
VKDGDILRIQVRPDKAGRLLHPSRIDIQEMDDADDDPDAEDDVEERLFVEECDKILFNIVGETGISLFCSFAFVPSGPVCEHPTFRSEHVRPRLKKLSAAWFRNRYKVLHPLRGFGIICTVVEREPIGIQLFEPRHDPPSIPIVEANIFTAHIESRQKPVLHPASAQ